MKHKRSREKGERRHALNKEATTILIFPNRFSGQQYLTGDAPPAEESAAIRNSLIKRIERSSGGFRIDARKLSERPYLEPNLVPLSIIQIQ